MSTEQQDHQAGREGSATAGLARLSAMVEEVSTGYAHQFGIATTRGSC
ncbi:MAG: hypothetical protein WCA46_05535 [Actinocatenispora sp.]